MKTCLLAILICTAFSSVAFGSERKLLGWISSGAWSQGVEYCNGDLAEDVSRRPDLRNVSTELLARIAVYCAALAGGAGDEHSSGWWWYTAASLDLKAAQRQLQKMRKKGLLLEVPPPRSRVTVLRAREEKDKKLVLLPSGEVVAGEPPEPVSKPEIPDYMARPITGIKGASVAVEVVVSREGVPRQPLLLFALSLPVHALYVYHYVRAWRFEPAKVGGEPVDSVYSLTVSVQRGQ